MSARGHCHECHHYRPWYRFGIHFGVMLDLCDYCRFARRYGMVVDSWSPRWQTFWAYRENLRHFGDKPQCGYADD